MLRDREELTLESGFTTRLCSPSQSTMDINHVIVLLGDNAVPFCYYEHQSNSHCDASLVGDLVLERVVAKSRSSRTALTVVHDRTYPVETYARIVEDTPHTRVVSIEDYTTPFGPSVEDVLVIDPDQWSQWWDPKCTYPRMAVLRLRVAEIEEIPRLVSEMDTKFERVNVCLLDVGSYSLKDYVRYYNALHDASRFVCQRYNTGSGTQWSFLTDRLRLRAMRNCGAGVSHLTLAPNGSLYICPAFYYANVSNPVGQIDRGAVIRDKELLSLDGSPLCSICDCYHCRRCVYMNKKLTCEANIPSQQQCVLSHIERECSRWLSRYLRIHKVGNFAAIAPLDYLDPLSLLAGMPDDIFGELVEHIAATVPTDREPKVCEPTDT